MADIYVATTGNDSTGTGASGAPYATPGKAVGVMAGGDTVYIKSGTYTHTTATTNIAGGPIRPPAGTAAAPTRIIGYNSAIGDLDGDTDDTNYPVLATTVGLGLIPITCLNSFVIFKNLIADAGGFVNKAVTLQADNIWMRNVVGKRGTTYGFELFAIVRCFRCRATGNTGSTSAGAGFLLAASHCLVFGCRADGNSSAGFYVTGTRGYIVSCIADGNTGASSDGFRFADADPSPVVINCTAYNNGRDGIRFDGSTDVSIPMAINNVSYGNGAYGLRSGVTTLTDALLDYNAFGSNTSGARSAVPTGAHDVTLTGNPFTNAGSGDFSLDSVTGEGAACRGAGAPAAFLPTASTGYPDIGAVQAQGAAASTAPVAARTIAASIGTY